MTNVEYANNDKRFLQICKIAGVSPTTRQASKFRMGKGSAYKFFNERKGFWNNIVNQWKINNSPLSG